MNDSDQMKDQQVDLKAWRLKVHSVDMALRELQSDPEKNPPRKLRSKTPFTRALPSRL
jgi:hypothetical protein